MATTHIENQPTAPVMNAHAARTCVIAAFFFMTVLLAGTGASPALAETNEEPVETELLRIEAIEPVFVERGQTNYMVTLRAVVTNNGETGDVRIEAIGRDDEGYILQNVRFSGTIREGETRAMIEQFQILGRTYERIVDWEVKR